MIAYHLSRPILGALLLAGCLVLADGAAANPEAVGPPPPASPPPVAALHRDLDVLHLRSHAAADRLADLDVGVHPLPPPRTWKVARR